MPALDILLYIVSALVVFAGLAGAILPAIPGPPLIVGGLWLASWVDGYAHVSVWTMTVIAIIGLIAIATDYIAGAVGAKRVGASKFAIMGATVGTIAGLFFGLPGLILGPFLGALAGELLNGNSVLRSTKVGIGTWVGMLVGMLTKIVLSFTMLGLWILMWFIV